MVGPPTMESLVEGSCGVEPPTMESLAERIDDKLEVGSCGEEPRTMESLQERIDQLEEGYAKQVDRIDFLEAQIEEVFKMSLSTQRDAENLEEHDAEQCRAIEQLEVHNKKHEAKLILLTQALFPTMTMGHSGAGSSSSQ